jgi:hypothetical protein
MINSNLGDDSAVETILNGAASFQNRQISSASSFH